MSTIKITPELLAEARATYVGKFTEELARAIIASADPGAAAVRRETGTEHGIDLGHGADVSKLKALICRCNSCTWLLVARGWPDQQWAIIREMRDAGKGG